MTVGRVVIVGAGQAGGWAARTLREEGYQGSIVLIGDEAHAPYERPPLSKEILLGASAPEQLTLVPEEELLSLQVEARFGVRVSRIDRERKRVFLASVQQLAGLGGAMDGGGDAEPLDYDALVLCTGGRARCLPIEGSGDERVHTLRTLDDALRLRAALTGAPGPVLVIGGGWIGLEVAASARQLGCEVTLVECADRLCQRSVAPDVSMALLNLHAANGVQVMLGAGVSALSACPADGRPAHSREAREEAGPAVLEATLTNGQSLHVAHVVMAAGLVSNDEQAAEAGLVCRNGIVVDDRCRSSDPAIYAAGDVAVTETAVDGVHMRLESWQNAQDQGMAAARAILGKDVNYRPTPLLWSQQFDQFIQIAGYVNDAVLTAIRELPGGGSIRFYLDGEETVCGAIGMNAGRDWRFARQLAERRQRVSPAALADLGQTLKTLAAAVAEA
ncbi:MAG: FAD-dependent oxidoreductase [Pusillimonas sp.]